MGKKATNQAANADLFDDVLKDELKRPPGVSSGREKTGAVDLKTNTKGTATVTETATGVPARKANKKSFENLDPSLQALLVHPDEERPSKADKLEATEIINVPEEEKSNVVSMPQTPAEAAQRNFDKTQKIQVAKSMPEPPKAFGKSMKVPASAYSSLEEQLQSANYLELAQNRVLELEKEVQKLRRDNEQLATAGQHFKSFAESVKQQLKQAEANFHNLKDIAEEEKKILTQSLEAKEIKIGALQDRLIDVEEKLNSSFDHVRIRERELENRLEIMKTESEAITSSKDEMILDLKKQLNLVNSDLEKYRIQNQKITSKMEGKEELLRRTVKALRIALTMLEGSRPDED